MNTTPNLSEQTDRQHLFDQAAHNRTAAQVSNMNMTRSQTMTRIKRTILASIVAATLLVAGSQALVAHHETKPVIASMCCWRRP